VTIELGSRGAGHVGDVVGVGDRYSGEGFAPEEAPPAFDEVQPGSTHGDEGLLDARMRGQPVADGAAGVAGEMVSDQIEITVGKGVVERAQERKVASGVACGRRPRHDLPVAHAQRPVDPDLLQSALIVERHLDAVAIRRPARGGWEIAWGYGTQFVDTEDRRSRRWLRVEGDDVRPFGMKSGSLLVAHSRVRRQRTPSRTQMCRT
jgi:hypothetical protein